MAAYLVAFQTTGWEAWWIVVGSLFSLGAGLFLGRYLWGRSAHSGEVALKAVSAKPQATDWEEKRSAPRYQVRPRKVLLAESSDHAGRIEGVLLNRSLGGLGLSVDQEIAGGKVLQVCLCESAEDDRWETIEVRYCRPERGRWTLGCKFLSPVSSSTCSTSCSNPTH